MSSQSVRRLLRPPLSEPVDILLADVAIRIQLSRTDYRKAEERYETLGEWIDRQGSPLEGRVELVYPQGSMAIGATTASRPATDEYDVDFIAQLDLPHGTPPRMVLDLLAESIRGEPGSLYYKMAERRNRCVTVHYADKMHADITPMIRLVGQPERESDLFQNKPGNPAELDLTLVANPYGFAEWFRAVTPIDYEFASVFGERAREYERLLLAAKADTEEMPNQEPVHRKSKAVIVHQLMKRWRNIRFDKRETRQPPSAMMAKLTADAANSTETLSEELLHQARAMRDELNLWHRARLLIHGQLFKYRYDRKALTGILAQTLGERKLGQAQNRLCIPSFDGRFGEVYIFKTPHHPDFRRDGCEPMVKVALATAAAPTFFQPLEHGGYTFVDGGVWANNPVMIALVDVLSCFDVPRENIRILSIGCGDEPYIVDRPKIVRGGALAWRDVIYAAMRLQSLNALGQAGLLIGADRVIRADAPASEEKIRMDDWERASAELPSAARAALDAVGSRVAEAFLQSAAEPYRSLIDFD